MRLETITNALAIESARTPAGWRWSASDLAWAGLVITWHESGRWRLEVHDGRSYGDGGESACLGQIRHGGTELVGTSLAATRRCVRAVNTALAASFKHCIPRRAPASIWSMGKVVALYGTGHSCDPLHESRYLGEAWALRRAKHWWRVRSS